MDKKRSVTILFLGNIERPEEYAKTDKLSDQIDFGRPTKVTLIRIPRLKRDLYGKITSITQAEPIKNFQIYFRNLQETTGKYSLLASNNELMTTSTNDILITPHKAFITDMIVIRGIFSKITLCIYGDLVDEKSAKLWKVNAGVCQSNDVMEIKRNIFEEKRWCIHKIEDDIRRSGEECLSLSIAQNQQEAANDDDINEPQIKNICNISQHLLNTFQQINEDQYIVKFRQSIETINNLLQKLFKSKQLGLYYPKQQNYSIQNEIPLPLVHICLESLKLHLSDQYRVLETLKMLAQIPRHANLIIESGGVTQISQLFLQLYKSNVIYFSTFKNLVLEVCIALSHWPNAAQKMVTKLQQNILEDIFMPLITKEKEKEIQEKKQKAKEKSRSRGKQKAARHKKSKSYQHSDSENDGKHKKEKKDKKDKKEKEKKKKSKQKQKEKNKKKDRSRQRQKSKERSKSKQRQQKKERKQKKQKKNKEKEKQVSKQKQSIKKQREPSPQNIESSQSEHSANKQSFYEVLFFIYLKEKNVKTLSLIKVLLEQIVQTLTKGKDISEQVALITSYLRDTKYLFNPGSQIINSKSLKIFATFQPFLNEYQSQNVDCRFISGKQRLKYPLKYNINPKIVKILNQINLSIIKNSHKQALGLGTPFDENFMVMMSQLIFQKEKPITSEFVRIVNSFKATGLMNLKRNEAAISIITQYIYKALLDDEGINTLLYIDQIHASLIKFVSFLNEDRTIFSTELKSRIRLLSNYATPYDHFTRAEAVFKTFCQYFLKLFKYENYELEINNKAKLTEFRKKQYQKLLNPFLYENLMENFALKNFNDVSTNQPLLQIDVTLKIFLVLCDYNKNIWTTFYENKLINGFASLLNKVSSLLIFYLSHSANRWTAYTYMKSYLLTIDNYMNVVKHLLMLFAKKCKYECAFNDLLEQDIFEEVQLYEKIIQIYIAAYNAYHDTSLMIYINKSQNKIKVIMSLVIQIIDQFVSSFQLISHHTRELKLTKFLQHLYIKHYSSLSSRPALITIYATIIKFSEGSSAKFLSSYLLDNHFILNKFILKEIAYVPNNDKSLLENIIRSNVYRADELISLNLSILIKHLYLKSQFTDKICDILEKIFDQIEDQYKENQEEIGKIGWTCINKFYLFSQLLIKSEISIKNKIDDKILRFFKKIIEFFRKKNDYKETTEYEERDIFIIFLKAKINYMGYFNRLFKENTENQTLFIQFYELTSKALTLQYFTFDKYEVINKEYIETINLYILKTCACYTNGLSEISLVASYQCLLLYGQMMENPYKPQTFINFSDLLNNLEKIIQEQLYVKTKQQMKEIQSIVTSIFYFLCTLTTTDSQFLFTTQSRRGAIVQLLGSYEKEFPFKYLRGLNIYKMIPQQFESLLFQYFNYPIVQKSILLKQKLQIKPPTKTKNTIYSKSLFNIISQHDPVSKARFKYIGGQWIGGDLNKTLFTPFKIRNYEQQIDKYLSKGHGVEMQVFHYRQYQSIRQQIEFNDLFYLFLKKDKFETVKKEVQKTIQLKDVVPRNTPQEVKKEPLKASPSPNKMDYQASFNRNSPTQNTSSHNAPSISHSKNNNNQDKGYQKPSYPRSNSNNSNNPSNYNNNSGSNYPRQNNQTNPLNNTNNTNNNFAPLGNPPMPGYNHPQYHHPQYYHPPMYQPNTRYPPYQQPPINAGGMYPPGQPIIGKPHTNPIPPGGMYNGGMMGMYNGMQSNIFLTPQEEHLFQEAYSLVNEIRSATIPESARNAKKYRLNSILSSQPRVHSKLKQLKEQQQL